MEMGQKIHKLRTEKGMTLEELGNIVGVGKSTVRKWENGMIANMRRDKILKVSEALGVSPAYLMGWEPVSDEDIGNAFANDNLFDIIDNIPALSPHEKSHFTNYLQLLEINRKKADNYVEQLLSIQEMDKALELNAAHARTDIEVTEEMKKHDDDIMNDDSEWE